MIKKISLIALLLTVTTVIFAQSNDRLLVAEATEAAVQSSRTEKTTGNNFSSDEDAGNKDNKAISVAQTDSNTQTWIITGCSSGMGRSLAKSALKAGFNVVVTAIDTETVQDIIAPYPNTSIAVALDVTDKDAVERAVKLGEERFGGIDVLINNAGYGYRSAVEEGDEGEVDELFATNFFGPVSMIKAVLPGMRARRNGTIVNTTSIAARNGAAGSGYYAATKAALEGLSDGLRKEVAPLGIRVLVVEPGQFRTNFTGSSLRGTSTEIADYDSTSGPRRKKNDRTYGTEPGDPDRLGQVLVEVISSGKKLPEILLLGSDAVRVITPRLEAQLKEIQEWKNVSERTDFPGADKTSRPTGY